MPYPFNQEDPRLGMQKPNMPGQSGMQKLGQSAMGRTMPSVAPPPPRPTSGIIGPGSPVGGGVGLKPPPPMMPVRPHGIAPNPAIGTPPAMPMPGPQMMSRPPMPGQMPMGAPGMMGQMGQQFPRPMGQPRVPMPGQLPPGVMPPQ